MTEDDVPPIPVNLPEGLDEGSLDEFREQHRGVYPLRHWMEEAIRAHGGRVTGAGCGFGEADIDVELDGERFNVVIRPRPAKTVAQ